MTPQERLALLKQRGELFKRNGKLPKQHPQHVGAGRPRESHRKLADSLGLTTMGLLYRERRAQGVCVTCGRAPGAPRCAPCRESYNRSRTPEPQRAVSCRRCRGTGHNIQTCPEPSGRDPVAHRARAAARPAPLGPVGVPTPAQLETLLAIARLPRCSYKELKAALGLKSMCAVQDRLRYLAAKGLVTWDIWRARTLQPTEAGWKVVSGRDPGPNSRQ